MLGHKAHHLVEEAKAILMHLNMMPVAEVIKENMDIFYKINLTVT